MAEVSIRDRVQRVLERVVSAHGVDLEDVVVSPAGRRRVLQVMVDRDGGVGLDDVATVSATVAAALEESDVMGATPYVLEVTSPGVDRPLTQPRQWRRAVDRLVRVPIADTGELAGRVLAVDDDGVLFALDGGQRQVPWADLGTGRVQVEFNRRTPAPVAGAGGDGVEAE